MTLEHDSPALAAWLERLEQRHPVEIELGLERTARVLSRMAPELGQATVITVAGTNGKGSTVAILEALYRAAGYRVLACTSPHLMRFSERFSLDGRPVEDAAIIESLERVEAARGTTPLTFFEHTTLAGLDLAGRERVEVLILEIGLGGRLDAANVVDPDVGVVTTIGLDHQAWLGDDLDSIGREKAGIARPGRPLVIGQPSPPAGLLEAAKETGARLIRAGEDFQVESGAGHWVLGFNGRRLKLPLPALAGAHQQANAAAAWVAACSLNHICPVREDHLRTALATVSLPGRFQRLARQPEIILDVAHNAQAAEGLAAGLDDGFSGRTIGVVAMLADKGPVAMARVLDSRVDHWLCAGLSGPRGRSGQDLARTLCNIPVTGPVEGLESVSTSLNRARELARVADRIVIFGSFYTVAEALKALEQER